MNRKKLLNIGVDILLIDGMNLVMKSAFSLKGLSTEAGVETGVIYGFLQSLSVTARKYMPTDIIVAWEGKYSKDWRRQIYSGYKAKRKEKSKIDMTPVWVQVDILHDFLHELGIGSIAVDGQEADDVIASLTYAYPDKSVVIASSDHDLLQLVTPNVIWYSGKDEIALTNFQNKVGVPIDRFIDMKVITGDSSDEIPGIKGIGEKTAKDLLNRIDLDRYVEKYTKQSALPRTKNLFEPNAVEIINRNRRLMDLSLQIISKTDLTNSMETSEPDWDSLRDMVEDYECWSILDDWDDFIVGFRNMDLKGELNG